MFEEASLAQHCTYGGFETVTRLLLDNRADINAEVGKFGTALQAAASCGHESLVRLLISKGADVRSQGGKPEKKPDRFSPWPAQKIVRKPVPHSRRQNGKFGTALQAAAFVGNEEIVRYCWRMERILETKTNMGRRHCIAPPIMDMNRWLDSS